MPTDEVVLAFAAEPRFVHLRELNGFDERSISGVSTAAAIQLLDALSTGAPPLRAVALTAADRDRLMAAVYRRAYGDRIAGTLRCAGCGSPYDLDFRLSELAASVEATGGVSNAARLEDGSFQFPQGGRFRLPTGEDECSIAALPAGEAERALAERCTIEGPVRVDELDEALEQVAPVIDVELDGCCPECGRHQTVPFRLESYVLGALRSERRRLLGEVHRLAAAYGWSLTEILSLARSERRELAELVENAR